IGLIRDPQRRNVDCLMLGYALARTAWGRGCMTEAADEVLHYGFEELGLGLITCAHYTFNDRSRRVIEKAWAHFHAVRFRRFGHGLGCVLHDIALRS
ncbi:GNAT family N-acetyltransferase, partial [Eggerthella lenta]|uniref:GNAT family N-acetyltransferase n=1 Tax=Eggerthella lenta TaxID=84112 RepID=UPI00210BCD7C